MYALFYSKPLLEDVKDPFSLFFEKNYKFGSLMNRKRITLKMLESIVSDYTHVYYMVSYKRGVLMTRNKHTCNCGSPGEIRTPVDGSKAHHACPLQSAKHFFSTGLNRVSRATFIFSYNFLVYINLSPMFIKYE